MSTAAAYGRAVLAVFVRDLLVYLSYRGRLPGQLITVILIVSLLHSFSRLVTSPEFPTPEDYFAFALIGVVILRALTLSFSSLALSMRQELVAGTFERLATSALGPILGTAAMTLFPLALSLFVGMATIAFAVVALGMSLEWSTVPLAFLAALLAALTLIPFSLMIAAATISFKQAGAAVRFFMIGIATVAGLLFPVTILPSWIEWMSEVQPFTPMVDLLRHLLLGTPLEDSVGTAVLKVAGFVAVLLPLAVYLLHASIERGRRRATLLEY